MELVSALFAPSPQTDREKDPDYDSLPSQTSQSESSMLQVICRPEATSKEEAYTFHTVHSTSEPPQLLCEDVVMCRLFGLQYISVGGWFS